METGSVDRFLVDKLGSYFQILNDPRAAALLAEYSAECSIPQLGKPEPQHEIYEAMDKSGLMHSFGFYEYGQMIGFATLLIHVLPHYGKRIANVESLFIAKAHRAHGVGEILKLSLEEYAKDRGCVGVLYNARVGSRLEQLLTLQPEYERTNSVFLRSLA
jgi:GNAT superfamily N-acetyltransferase